MMRSRSGSAASQRRSSPRLARMVAQEAQDQAAVMTPSSRSLAASARGCPSTTVSHRDPRGGVRLRVEEDLRVADALRMRRAAGTPS